MRWLAAFLVLGACGKDAAAPSRPIEIATVTCPEGSGFDTARGFCVATPPPPPPPPALVHDAGTATTTIVPVATVEDSGAPVVTVAAATGGNVIVTCDFPEGWVSLLPVAAYPKDDSFLMQSLIGLTEDPKFWNGAGYAKLSPFKAKKCPRTGVGFTVASGDYWILAGQANTFGAKGKYDKNGVRRKTTIAIGTTPAKIQLGTSDLVHTWLCISCPWVLAPGIDAFTVLRNRDGKGKRGTDTIALHGLIVENKRVRMRVAERERETSYLAEMRLVVRGKSISPTALALASNDGLDVLMARGTEIAVDFVVDAPDGPIDADLIVTGHYEPDEAPWIVDLHVDLPWSSLAKKDLAELSADRLARGRVRTLVVPLFVEDAWKMTPSAARDAYALTFAAFEKAKPSVGTRLAFEGADGFAGDPSAVDPWIARGACFFGLVHSHSNALGGASQDPNPSARDRGLTPAGRALAEHIVSKGGLLDLAHASDRTQDDLLSIAKAANKPVVDTHTGMRSLVAIDRNLSDERAKAIAATGGVIGISLHSGHISAHAGATATLAEYVDHIEHLAKIAGFDHVAIGSDLAGAIRPPEGSDGAATWPWVEEILRTRGWSDAQIAALFHANAERVLATCPQPQ
jgi:microsomal dipeptidase-like Zn-dependent dipeptidase